MRSASIDMTGVEEADSIARRIQAIFSMQELQQMRATIEMVTQIQIHKRPFG